MRANQESWFRSGHGEREREREREREKVCACDLGLAPKKKKPLELESLLLLLFGLGLFVCFSFFFFGCFSGFLQIKVNLIRSNLPFFSFYSDLISLFWLKSKSAAWSSSTVAAKVDQSLLRLSLKSTPMMTTPCSLAKSNQNLRIQTPFTWKHKYKTMKLQSKQKKKKNSAKRNCFFAYQIVEWERENDG